MSAARIRKIMALLYIQRTFDQALSSLLNVDPNVIIGSVPGVPGWDPFGDRASLLARLRSSFRPALGELARSAQTNVNRSSQAINRFNGSYWCLDAYENRTNNFGPRRQIPRSLPSRPHGRDVESVRHGALGGELRRQELSANRGHDWRTSWMLGADPHCQQCRYPGFTSRQR